MLSTKWAVVVAIYIACCGLVVAQAALSADEAAMQLISRNCKFSASVPGWPLAAGAGACSKVGLPRNPYLTVTCDSQKRVTELLFGFTPAASFDCLTDTLKRFKKLRKLQFAGGGFTGTLPAAWGGLPTLQASLLELSVRDHRLSGPLPDRWGNLQRLRRLEVTGRDCCLSTLKGPLPANWGRLYRLEYLNIAFNQMASTLPPQWDGMTALKEIYLSVNRFSGPIPPSWSKLTSLQTLMVAANDGLCGPIPASLAGKVQGFSGTPKC